MCLCLSSSVTLNLCCFPCKRNRFTGVCVVSVCAGPPSGWDDDAGSLSRSDTGFVSLSPYDVPSGTVSGSRYTLRVVTGGFRPYFRRYSYRRASPRTRCCLHVPTRTLCILASESISLGLPRRHHQVLRYEGDALSLMTSEPPSSLPTHRRTVLARTTCPISFTTRCSSLSSVRPTHIDRNVRGVPFATTRTSPGFRSDGVKHSTIANNGRIGDLYGLPGRRSNDVAPPLCG